MRKPKLRAIRIDRTTDVRENQTANALADANSKITAFEAQVAGLLASQQENCKYSILENRRDELMSEAEALNLALPKHEMRLMSPQKKHVAKPVNEKRWKR